MSILTAIVDLVRLLVDLIRAQRTFGVVRTIMCRPMACVSRRSSMFSNRSRPKEANRFVTSVPPLCEAAR